MGGGGRLFWVEEIVWIVGLVLFVGGRKGGRAVVVLCIFSIFLGKEELFLVSCCFRV